jgi:hypothetical protein
VQDNTTTPSVVTPTTTICYWSRRALRHGIVCFTAINSGTG